MRFINCYSDTEDNSILDIEPIDIVIKYIDLSDPNLKRKGIPNIKKVNDF